MCVLGGISFVAGMVFLLAGAWPVFGFFGLDVLLVYWAFRANYRSARAYEEVTVTPSELTVRKVSHHGQVREWTLNRSGCGSTATCTRSSASSGCSWCRADAGCDRGLPRTAGEAGFAHALAAALGEASAARPA